MISDDQRNPSVSSEDLSDAATFADFDMSIARARLCVLTPDSPHPHIDPVALSQLPGRFGGHGSMPHVAEPGEASYHDAAFYGSFAAVWHYMRTWIPALRGRQLAHRGPDDVLPYQRHVAEAWDRLASAHRAVSLQPGHADLLPADARFPDLHSRLDDGRLSPATAPLGQGAAGQFDDDPADSPAYLFDLDCLDVACHPHAQRAASAVVASLGFLSLYNRPTTTPTGRARMLDGSVSRGPFSFWRRIPDLNAHLPHNPFFAFTNPEHFPVALALDLLIPPPVPLTHTHSHPATISSTVCHACFPPPHSGVTGPPTIDPPDRHFVQCMHGVRLHTVCHDPAVQALIPFLDAIHGAHRVIAERGGHGGHTSLHAWMQGPGAGLRHIPDIVLENFDGPNSFLLIDVKTLDVAGPTHLAVRHTDRVRLAAHRHVTAHSHTHDYGVLPDRMRLVIIPISTFGAIGPSGHPFISELSRRMRASVPYSLLAHTSWATPRVGPMIRMALTHAVRRGLAASVHTHWRCGDGSWSGGDGADGDGANSDG